MVKKTFTTKSTWCVMEILHSTMTMIAMFLSASNHSWCLIILWCDVAVEITVLRLWCCLIMGVSSCIGERGDVTGKIVSIKKCWAWLLSSIIFSKRFFFIRYFLNMKNEMTLSAMSMRHIETLRNMRNEKMSELPSWLAAKGDVSVTYFL